MRVSCPTKGVLFSVAGVVRQGRGFGLFECGWSLAVDSRWQDRDARWGGGASGGWLGLACGVGLVGGGGLGGVCAFGKGGGGGGGGRGGPGWVGDTTMSLFAREYDKDCWSLEKGIGQGFGSK